MKKFKRKPNGYMKIAGIFLLIILLAQVVSAQDSISNSIGMQLVRIDTGRFVMGRFQPPYSQFDSSKPSTPETYSAKQFALAKTLARRDARPGFVVQIKRCFYIGKFEVTQAQWQAVMGNNPSQFQDSSVSGNAGSHPVENITWNDVQRFLKALNAREKGKQYRLPTEAEWEWAARAGVADDISWAQIRQTAQLEGRTTSAVGSKQPNAWGLYDMLGNVWEWVADWYNEKLFADSVPATSGHTHVLKGASFTGDVKNATYLTHAGGPGNGWDVGFRVLLEID